jgi:hypothetical protein
MRRSAELLFAEGRGREGKETYRSAVWARGGASMKPRILITPLCGGERDGWVNPFLLSNLILASHDMRFSVAIEPVVDKHPVDYARNVCIAMARERNVDTLLMVDADQSWWPGYNPLNMLPNDLASKPVIGIPTMQRFSPEEACKGGEPFIPNFRTMDGHKVENSGEYFSASHVGTGAMFIHRRIWEEVIPRGPWFVWRYKEDSELHETDGFAGSEDFGFCELCARHNVPIWVHRRPIPHWKTCECTMLGMHVKGFKQMAEQAAQAGILQPKEIAWNLKSDGAK